ncbi:DUF2284 domain-containing protein [Methanospirillum lacunae]|uniref:Metal-binding protein n=1 Tax=Methanospirillum lacunae TaxID=668570 RepID=A0A2V2NEI7_9EURY|nr:DUF2284 domain-containing protein [Methanospirillum lacunae]PWR73733.1 metal-binding protein [Methanospirillum lacunae]
MNQDESEITQFEFLRQTALNLGATDTRVIKSSEVIVENRVPLKCRTGCITYGTKLTCPPHVPTPDEFRTILSEYRYALLVKFTSPALADPDIICSLTQLMNDKKGDPDKREKATAFMSQYVEGNTDRLNTMLELEKQAFNAGYTFALAFVNGSCRLCETCNTKEGKCLHPTRARIPEHAVGINMIKTAERAGIPISFPVIGHPSPMALLLID